MSVKDTLLAVSGLLGGGSGGGGEITLETLNVSVNGTTNAPSGKAYDKVITNVEPQYGFVDATYVDDTWQGSVSGNVFTLTYPTSTTRYFLFKRPIVLQPEVDVLKVECKKVSGTASYTDLRISTIPYGAGINVDQNFMPSATVHASEYTNSHPFPITVVGLGYCTRSAGGGYSNLKLQVRVSLNDVVLFSSIT